MAFNFNKKKGPISEINVTPLVDVMLVLLVIFMITAPLMLNGIKLDLPKTKEVNPVRLNTQQVILSYTKGLEIYIGKEKVLYSELVKIVKNELLLTKTETLFVRADFALPYGEIAKIDVTFKKEWHFKNCISPRRSRIGKFDCNFFFS